MRRLASFAPAACAAVLFFGPARSSNAPEIVRGIAPGTPVCTPSEVPSGPQRSWPVAIGENFSSPMLADLTGDGIMEIIATDRQRTYVFDAQGSLLPGWPVATGEVDNTPAVADLDEDGEPEVIVASAGAPPKIHVLKADGTYVAGFPVALPYQYWLNVSCPAVGDVDGDGHPDVGAQTEPGVAFFDRFGHALEGWPYLWTTSQNIVWSGPAMADLDGDGHNEVVVGNNNLTASGVHAIRSDGSAMPGWPRATESIFSSPALGDLDGDGDLEIVIQEGDNTWYGNRMHIWHHDGTYLAGWPREIAPQWESSRSSPAIVDIDGNGTPEIVTVTCDGMLHVFRPDGSELLGYPRPVPSTPISSVQVIDIDGDGIEEIFLCSYESSSQWVFGWRLDGTTLQGFPKLLYPGAIIAAHGSVHLADLDGDGHLDLVGQGSTAGAGRVCLYEVDGSDFQPGVNRADWPKIRRDSWNTGLYIRLDPSAVPAEGERYALRLCPNPARPGDRVRLELPAGSGGRVLVFDPLGRRIGERVVVPGTAGGIDLESTAVPRLGSGVYFLRWIPQGGGPRAGARLVLVP